MSEHNSLLCGGQLYDNHFLILSQLSSWQLTVHMHQIGSLICNKDNKLIKMTILFVLCEARGLALVSSSATYYYQFLALFSGSSLIPTK